MQLGKWIGLVVFIATLYILWQIRYILLLIFAAVVLATALAQLVQLLQQLGVKQRGLAIVLIIGLLLGIVTIFLILIVPPFIDQLQQLADFIPQTFDWLQGWVNRLQDLLSQQPIRIDSLSGLTQQLRSFSYLQIGNLFQLFSNSVGMLFSTLLVLVLSIMMLANPTPYRQGLIMLFPSFYRRRADQILHRCKTELGGWAVGILFNMTVIAVFSGIGLWILQVPLPLANAILAGILTFIPNVGPTLSVIPPAALAFMDTPWRGIAVIILYIVIQQLESNVLTPLVMKQQVSLLPAVTLASQFIFATFFGFLGLFLALPLMVVFQVWIKELLIKDILNRWQEPKSRSSPTQYDCDSS